MDNTAALDPAQLARATKKVVDRLAPFCSLRLDTSSTSTSSSKAGSPAATPFGSPSISPAPSVSNAIHVQVASSSIGHGEPGQVPSSSPPVPDPSRVVLKIKSKVQALISAIDAHVKACQIALEVSQHTEPSSPDNLYRARQGLELSKGTEAVFMKVSQDIYKIASHTKDRSEVALVPPGAGQEPSLRLTLSKVGLDLVANLGLFLQYAAMVEQTVSYWTSTIERLEAIEQPEATNDSDVPNPSSAIHEDWQAYGDIVSPLRDEYHELFPLSSESPSGANLSIEEMLQSGEYEFLETEDGYVILSRRIPMPPLIEASFSSQKGKALRRLLTGKEVGATGSGMRGLLMWDCSRRRRHTASEHDSVVQAKRRRSLRTFSMRKTKKEDPHVA